jgi:hypothetical protein
MNTPNTGAYRALFTKALLAYKPESEQEQAHVEHYLRLLADTEYKFGRFTSGSPVYVDNLFFRS